MKLARLTLLAGLVFSTAALAHPPGPPDGERLEKMSTELGLNDGQKAELKRIFDEQHARRESERAQFDASGTRPTREQMQAKREESRTQVHQQLSTVLTAEQLTKFDQMMKDRKDRGPRGRDKSGKDDSSKE